MRGASPLALPVSHPRVVSGRGRHVGRGGDGPGGYMATGFPVGQSISKFDHARVAAVVKL